MITKYVLPLIAVCGIVFAVVFVRAGNQVVPPAPPVAEPARAPFASYIAGAGLVEASSENIAVGAVVPGVAREVLVKVGDRVTRGQPLFRVDDLDLQAQMLTSKAAVALARARLGVAEATLADNKNQFDRWQQIKEEDPRAVSKDEYDRRFYAVQTSEARVAEARAEVAAAEAQVQATQTLIDRTVVRSPIDGEMLQVKIRAGEFAPAGTSSPMMLVGAVQTLHVRIDVDENDAWRLKAGARARAFLRGNSSLSTDATFVAIEPYVIPKRSLTGESTERVDTRVLQVLYSFPKDAIPVYVGQQMDVFIEAPPITAPTAAAGQ